MRKALEGSQAIAQAVARCLEEPVSPMAPASILQTHPDVTVYLDEPAAAQLSGRVPVERE